MKAKAAMLQTKPPGRSGAFAPLADVAPTVESDSEPNP
jgi:hypothetical protein